MRCPEPVSDPTVIRAALPTPDAVIVREANGDLFVVADQSLPDDYVQTLVNEAPHLRDCGRALS